MKTEITGVIAWLMQVDRLVNVAVGQFELIHIVDEPEYVKVPQTPDYCNQVVVWNDSIVPVMNLESWMSGGPQRKSFTVVAILAYRNVHGEYLYGGLKLENAPTQVRVKNDQQCHLSEKLNKWKNISFSCFKSAAGDIVPVLDINKLFSQMIK